MQVEFKEIENTLRRMWKGVKYRIKKNHKFLGILGTFQ